MLFADIGNELIRLNINANILAMRAPDFCFVLEQQIYEKETSIL